MPTFTLLHKSLRAFVETSSLFKTAKMMTYKLKQETDWDWNYIDPPTREMQFTVTFGSDGRVLRTLNRERLPDEPRG